MFPFAKSAELRYASWQNEYSKPQEVKQGWQSNSAYLQPSNSM